MGAPYVYIYIYIYDISRLRVNDRGTDDVLRRFRVATLAVEKQ